MGLIERDAKFSRAVRLTDPVSRELVKVPILGPIAAGEPMLVPAPGAPTLALATKWTRVDVARSLLPNRRKRHRALCPEGAKASP